MTISEDQLGSTADAEPHQPMSAQVITAEFRGDLAFPKLTEEMVRRLHQHGRQESVPANVTLYTLGDRGTDMFVILEGEVDVILPSPDGDRKVFARHRKFDFSGEFSLLNSQRSVSEVRTAIETRVLRISHQELRVLMRVEGNIANLVVRARFGGASSIVPGSDDTPRNFI